MTSDTKSFGYSHTQTAPLCLLVYAVGASLLVLGCFIRDTPPIPWLFPPLGLLLLILARGFHHLMVCDVGDHLAIKFGPLPLFRRTVPYSDIIKVEIGQSLLLDGWGIHRSIRGGWVWNLWGRDCVVVHFRSGDVLRIGTNDAQNLASFLQSRMNP